MKKAFTSRLATAMVLTILTVLSLSAGAAELRLTLANDPVTGNDRKDDLYTSETAFELQLPNRRIVFSERMFTNRESGYRFDETWAGVAFSHFDLGSWDTRTELGLLHVGRGILGESVQNGVHRVVGSEEVHLPYIEEDSFHPTASMALRRGLGKPVAPPAWVDVRLETAPAFRSTLAVRVGATRPLGHGVLVEASAGVRGDYVESKWLEGVVHDAGPTATVALAWRGVAITVSHNRYGTGSNHVTLGWRAELAR